MCEIRPLLLALYAPVVVALGSSSTVSVISESEASYGLEI